MKAPVPPVAVVVTVVDPPLAAMVPAVMVATIAAGWVIVMVFVPVVPFASVTVKVFTPALTVKIPVPVYGDLPPVALMVTVVVPPLQEMVPATEEITKGETPDIDTVKLFTNVQPLLSFEVNEWVPAATFEKTLLV